MTEITSPSTPKRKSPAACASLPSNHDVKEPSNARQTNTRQNGLVATVDACEKPAGHDPSLGDPILRRRAIHAIFPAAREHI